MKPTQTNRTTGTIEDFSGDQAAHCGETLRECWTSAYMAKHQRGLLEPYTPDSIDILEWKLGFKGWVSWSSRLSLPTRLKNARYSPYGSPVASLPKSRVSNEKCLGSQRTRREACQQSLNTKTPTLIRNTQIYKPGPEPKE